jgi:hypothetical protein
MEASLARFKPSRLSEYDFVGRNDTDPCRRSGAPFLRRVRWNVWLADERIVPAANSSVHCGSSLCMKRDALLPLSLVKGNDRQTERPRKMETEPRELGFSVGFQQISDFRQELFFIGRTGSRRRPLEPIHLSDHQEQAKGNDQEFDHRIDKHPIGKNWYSSVGSLLYGGYLLAIQHNKEVGKIDLSKNQTKDRHKNVVN